MEDPFEVMFETLLNSLLHHFGRLALITFEAEDTLEETFEVTFEVTFERSTPMAA